MARVGILRVADCVKNPVGCEDIVGFEKQEFLIENAYVGD